MPRYLNMHRRHHRRLQHVKQGAWAHLRRRDIEQRTRCHQRCRLAKHAAAAASATAAVAAAAAAAAAGG